MIMVSLGWLHVTVFSLLFSAANIYGSSLGWLEKTSTTYVNATFMLIYTGNNQNSINNIA